MKKMIILAIICSAAGFGAGWFLFRPTQEVGTSSQRKLLYYRNPMNPQETSSTPKKAPDGMDFVPVYAEEESSAGEKERKILYYVDPMHPAYKSDKPGTAPDCGMDLVPVYADAQGGSAEGGGIPGAIKISPEKQQLIGVQTSVVAFDDAYQAIRAVGQINYAEPKQAYVTTKFEGYIEELFVDYTGKLVEKGQPLFSVYSPELVSTQEEFLLALKTQNTLQQNASAEASAGAMTLLESAKRRLSLWDITPEEIDELARSGKIKKTLTIAAPMRGYVVEKVALRGLKIMPGMNLYQIADLSTVWVLAELYEYEIPFVKIGQEATVTLTYAPGEAWHGRVTYIYPFLSPETRTVRVRLEFPNPDEKLKPGMYANVDLRSDLGRQLTVAEEAVLDAGAEKLVFVAHEGGYFEPRQVALGAKAGDRFIVFRGLAEGEKVVTSGNFLIDSESRLKSAVQGMAEMSHGAPIDESVSPPSPQDPPLSQSKTPIRAGHVIPESSQVNQLSLHDSSRVEHRKVGKYVCPMHPEVVADAPGNCPKCGMKLVEMP